MKPESAFPSYPAYKDSRVQWLRDVPTHWDMLPLLSCFQQRVCPNAGGRISRVLSLSYGKIIDRDVESNNGLLPESFDGYNIVEPDDIVLRLTDLQNDQRSLRTGQVKVRGIITSAYVTVKPCQKVHIVFATYLLHGLDLLKVFYALGGGVRQSIKFGDLRRLPIALPPFPEQQAIAAFLDRETAKTDMLIEKQEHLVSLLTEKRQEVISRAVTKGLDPNVPMKDSGIEWIGKVPQHWDVGKIMHWFGTMSGSTPDTTQQTLYYHVDGFPWIRTTDLNNDYLSTYEVGITEAALRNSACTMLPANSVLIAMYGGDGTIGKNSLLRISACINQAVCALLPSKHFQPEFAFRFIQFYRPHWMYGAESSRKDPNISQYLIRHAPFLRPPLFEQKAISEFLEGEISRINTLVHKAQTSIDLLRERRSTLISTAVTGKIDVREAV